MSDRILISHRHRLKGYPHFGLYLQTKVVRARSNLRLLFPTFIIYHTWAHVKKVEQNLWEDYSTPNSEPFLPFSLIHNRTDDFGASFALLGRKALQPFLPTFATAHVNVCGKRCHYLGYIHYIYIIIREQYGNLICIGFVSSGHVSMARHSYPHKKQERERSIIPLSHSIPANAWIFHPTARSVWADAYSSP